MNLAKKVTTVAGIAVCFGIGVLAFHNWGRAPTIRTSRPESKGERQPWEKMFRVPTDDPEFEKAQLEAIEARLKVEREQRLKEARDEKLRVMAIWQGTEFAQLALDEKGKPPNKPLASIAEAAAPESREIDFAWCSENGFKLVGWMVNVLDQAEFADGWNVLIEVRPKLMHIDHAVPCSFQVSTETWWIPKEGEAKLVSYHPGKQTGPNTVVFD